MNQNCFICPGCKYLGSDNILKFSKRFICSVCSEKAKTSVDTKELNLRKTFAEHRKKGYKCPNCKRFIPEPLIGLNLSCPYYDCWFAGTSEGLKSMRHPSAVMDVSMSDLLTKKTEAEESVLSLKILREAITEEINTVAFSSNNSTVIHKISIGQAFLNLTHKMPSQMTDYLVNGKKNSSLQSKLFQEYISILENKLPFTYKKKKSVVLVDSLLSDELSLFDGISTFEAEISSKKEIKNGTKEFYVGGRTGFHSKPFYIGKLLNVINVETKQSILDDVKEYSFLRLLFNKTPPETRVLVSHLRVPPHYQMGGMAHLNRMRKRIVKLVKDKSTVEIL